MRSLFNITFLEKDITYISCAFSWLLMVGDYDHKNMWWSLDRLWSWIMRVDNDYEIRKEDDIEDCDY